MIAYDAKCPYCGHMNIDMYLEETEGWMECEKCGHLHQYERFSRSVKIPVFDMDAIPKEILDWAKPVA